MQILRISQLLIASVLSVASFKAINHSRLQSFKRFPLLSMSSSLPKNEEGKIYTYHQRY